MKIHRVELNLNDYEHDRLMRMVEKTDTNKNTVIRNLITKARLHEKPTEEFYDFLYDIHRLSFNIECLLRRIDSRTATAAHLEDVTEEIDRIYERLVAQYLY
ncbi:MAG: hypothetical protein J5959_19460 [Butyrivibrio sp.]|nr:hypothetical protein [Butyrivibrio sp.]MBP3240489.1 hypothetical protein [Oribacterium sp.]